MLNRDKTLFCQSKLVIISWSKLVIKWTRLVIVCTSWSLPGPSQIGHLRPATNQLLAKSKRWFWEHGGQPANNQL